MDGRTTPFLKKIKGLDKRDILEGFLDGSFDEYDVNMVYAACRFTSKEKSALIADPRFKLLWNAKRVDAFFGKVVLTRQDNDIMKSLGEQLGYQTKDSGVTRTLKATAGTRFEITAKPSKEPIDVTPENGTQEET